MYVWTCCGESKAICNRIINMDVGHIMGKVALSHMCKSEIKAMCTGSDACYMLYLS